ncbi:HelD family protein [Clostridium luticellarii]|jgi:DNA helicase-2/ATP-dependent DNA helicase PcrA|uniref:HelD family protein n=1 Tax=Clostridium luticellarii TaxID=1691940 RepID=UPI0023524B74|nr:UvrD-helicase domain-containing protein [Clostridium luticellarii]MCI1945455.1 AAA family ATPase [Clostridium luticellarii]MCI1968788.1 AAA family ATPase [Clostridium luticellarii]MCI1994938.1 AAA family ATPase [Clostridium luticellarii]MCI2040215.1 AAA family ATPase [Clostridium luticellarii]
MYEDDLESELNREIQLNSEREKLNEVLKQIDAKMMESIGFRKKVVDYILYLRKKNLEQYEDDEDRTVEYFNHEVYTKEEQFRLINKSIRELTVLKGTPYFGKVSFEDEYGVEEIYIGRFGMSSREDYEPVIVDWRSPVCSLFYSGSLGSTSYRSPGGTVKADVLGKRQFIIKKSKLLGMFDSNMDVKDEILQMVLSKNSGQKLKDIVMTIQKEQDALIRQPREGAVVVNGIAGSGKTTVALHRVAYLLYNYRKLLQGKVLILGPNSIFMDYISLVLPSLGEEGVTQLTFGEFAESILHLPDIMDLKEYMENILRADKQFMDEIIYKNSLEFIADMDKLVSRLEKNCFAAENVLFYDKIIVTKEEMENMLGYYFKDMPLFKRSRRLKGVIYSRIKDERNVRVQSIQKKYRRKIENMTKEELNAQGTNLEYKKRIEIEEVIKEVIRIKKRKLKWLEEPDIVSLYKNFNGDKKLIYDDLAAILYLKMKLDGSRYREKMKHIVIDEAQDYSPLQFKVIKELTGCRSFTVVGDVNQRIVPSKEVPAMMNLNDIFSGLEIKNFLLNKSYRSTNEITSYANRYLKNSRNISPIRRGTEVVEKKMDNLEELADRILEDIEKLKEKGYESTAVICRDLADTEALGSLLKKKTYIKLISGENMIYSSGEVILPSYFSKGLEFDAVIMVDSSYQSDENTLKYIVASRALHELHVYSISSITREKELRQYE